MDFRVLPRGCPMELHNLVFSLEYLVFNGRQVLLGGIRLGGSATPMQQGPDIKTYWRTMKLTGRLESV